ncbi:hypothetical protein [Longimicrobium sp.]|uniref:hypothetical protein n=1 Tax=Longimicrobium sp. TaxID=2029185 RepID=UPI002BC59A05|nr:hypothetical protein [Longimicrobium sp.]HSU14859.1 hypothetical protein [Longimicrobium sp.]
MTLESVIAHPVVGLLAVFGCVALVFRLARAALRLGLSTLESASAGGLVEVSIRHGDLTGMAERQAQARAARRARLRAILLVLLWAALLVAPVVAGISRPVYALAALLWLLPRKPVRLGGMGKRVRRA